MLSLHFLSLAGLQLTPQVKSGQGGGEWQAEPEESQRLFPYEARLGITSGGIKAGLRRQRWGNHTDNGISTL